MRRAIRVFSAMAALSAASAMTPQPAEATSCIYRDCLNQLDECVYDFGLPPESCSRAYGICLTLCEPS